MRSGDFHEWRLTWIPISERLPDTDRTVLAATEDEEYPVWLAYYNSTGWSGIDGFGVNVTHWMELPKGPK